MWLTDFLVQQIDEKLDGDKNRFPELFLDDAIFDQLIELGNKNHGFYFESNTFDGEYLIKTERGYTTYSQDHGRRGFHSDFPDLQSAAIFFFSREIERL